MTAAAPGVPGGSRAPIGAGPGAFGFARREPPSCQCPHASAARSGRVGALPHGYAALLAVASIGDGPAPDVAPRFVDVPPRAHWIVLERPGAYDGTYEVRSQSGALERARPMSSVGSHLLARDDGYVLRDVPMAWSGAVDWNEGFALNQGGEVLALALDAGATRSIITSPDGQRNDRPPPPDFIRVEASRLSDDGTDAWRTWALKLDEPGVGAIDGAGRAVVAAASGRLLVLAPDCDPQHDPIPLLDVAIEPSATDLSIVPPYALLLFGGGDAGTLAAARGRSYLSPRIEAIRADGEVAWRVPLPFAPGQPPLDGNGRIYVVGQGIVALGLDGGLLWRLESQQPLRAAAFADGTLAVVGGHWLQIIGPDGVVQCSLRAPETITTYPAIDADGDVWIASATTLALAR